MSDSMNMHGTTILALLDDHGVAMAGDGQVTFGQSIAMKHKARKVRRIYKDKVLVGFAGATADAFTLVERFEDKLEEYNGNLMRASVELAKDWRKDKYLRRLEAMLLVSDGCSLLILTGNGDVIEPDDKMAAVGSGGPYALAAAKALSRKTDLAKDEITRTAMDIAAEMCVYTNNQIILEIIPRG